MLYTIPLNAVMAKFADSTNEKKVRKTTGDKLRNAQVINERDGN